MHAIGSGITADSKYLHNKTSALNTISQWVYTATRPKLHSSIITVIIKLQNETLGKFESTGVRHRQLDMNGTCTELS